MTFQPKQITTTKTHSNRHNTGQRLPNRHIMGIAPAVTHYRDHHKIIEAIEKCSLQATFGPEVTSTGDLLPKRSDVSSVVTLKASHNSTIVPVEKASHNSTIIPFDKASHNSTIIPVEKGTRFNRIPFFSAQPRVNASLPSTDLTNECGNHPSGLTTNDGGIPVISTNQYGSIPSEWSTNSGSVRAVSTYEDGMTSFRQSNLLARVPVEVWGQRVSTHFFIQEPALLTFSSLLG